MSKVSRAQLFGVVLSEDANELPTEFRIFSMGVNPSEKGDFLVDPESLQSVMASYAHHNKALLIDYNHATLLEAPTPEQAVAAGEFVPQVRADGLWATDVKWTPRAEAFLRAKEYRFFSPTFDHDTKTGRVLRLINVALTNLPALNGITPLVAANAKQEEPMACESCSALTARLNTMEEECKALRAKLSTFEDKETEKASAVSLRASVLSLTGKATDAEALGVLQALRSSHEEHARLRAQVEQEKTARLSAEFKTVLDDAVGGKEPKVTPAQRGFWEGIAKEDGVEKATARLRAYLDTATTLSVGTTHTQPADKLNVAGVQAEVLSQMGISTDAFVKSEQARLAGGR